MAGPNFSDLGVVDPVTGKKVYLSAGEISTVMGSTGGVAPSTFQAVTDGVFKGIDAGQRIQSNYNIMQQQGANLASTQAHTESMQLQNEIARQTQQAEITAKNNQIRQHAIQSQVATTQLENENQVLSAVNSGDPTALIKVISDPKLTSAAIKYDAEISAVAGTFKSQGAFQPQDLKALDQYNLTRSIFKNGDAEQAYQTTGKAVAGLPEVQELARQAGMPVSQVLAQMTTKTIPRGGATGTEMVEEHQVLSVGDKEVRLPSKDNDTTNKLLTPFFSARQGVTDPTPLKPPTSYGRPATPAPAPSAPAVEGQAAPQAPAQTAETPAAIGAPTQAPTAPNPNAINAFGQPIQTQIPQLQGLNKKTVESGALKGSPVSAAISRRAQQLFMEGQTPAAAHSNAMKEILRRAPASAKVKDMTTDTETLAQNKRLMADEIDRAVTDAETVGYTLGPNWGDTAGRVAANVGSLGDSIDSMISGTPRTGPSLGDVKSKFADLKSRYSLDVIKSSGAGTSIFNSNVERQALEAQTPQEYSTAAQNRAIANRLRGEARALEDENTILQTLDQLDQDPASMPVLVKKYHKDNPINVFDEATGQVTLNTKRADPVDWLYEQLGIPKQAAVQDTFATPTVAPKTAQQPGGATGTWGAQPPAPGSGTGTPFAPAQKPQPSGFQPTAFTAQARGSNYNSTPASLKDLKAIAETVANGGNIRQFQGNGSVPLKLDRVTPDLAARLIGAETGGRVNAVSPTGVKGLAQVTNATFKDVANNQDPALQMSLTDRTNPVESVVAGTQYLNRMLKKYDGNVDIALAAYNAGPGAVDNALEQAGTSPSSATIDMIGEFLPTTQDTVGYVKKITSRGRVAPESAAPAKGGGGFFDSVLSALNPIGTAEAAELPPHPNDNMPLMGDKGTVTLELGDNPDGSGSGKGSGASGSWAPISDAASAPSTDATVKVPELETSPRGDLPPTSELIGALKTQDPTSPIGPNGIPKNEAVEAIRNSAVGKFISENIIGSDAFGGAENFANAVTFGLYDEGLGVLETSMGFDGAAMRDEVRASLKDFRRENPKLALTTDILGSVAGGVGGGMVLRALGWGAKAVQAGRAAETIGTAGVGTLAKVGAAEGAARGFGEGESIGGRVTGAVVGGTVGAAFGGTAGSISKVPVVGNPAVVGAGVGALAGGLLGDQPSDVAAGAAMGSTAMASTAVASRIAPSLVKAIGRTVAKLNNYAGLQTLANLFSKTTTGKTASEIASDLSPDEAYIAKLYTYLPDDELKSVIDELAKTKKENPNIPLRLIDTLNQVEPKTLIKVIRQMGDHPEVATKVNRFLEERANGQIDRMSSVLGTSDEIAPVAQTIVNALKTTSKGARDFVQEVTSPIYAQAKQSTPKFDSPVISDLLSKDVVQKAVASARQDLKSVMSQAKNASDPKQMSDLLFERIKAGQSIDDIINPDAALTDNSFDVLTLARRKLDDQIAETSNAKLKKDIIGIQTTLTKELGNLSPEWSIANEAYEKILSKTDVLREGQVKIIADLADGGKIDLALGKMMRLPTEQLSEVVDVVGKPDIFREGAKKYLVSKYAKAVEGKDVASKLIPVGERKNLEVLMGKDELDKLMNVVDAESKVTRANRAMGGGSDTIPKGQATQTLAEMEGRETGMLDTFASSIGGTPHMAVINTVRTLLRRFVPKGNPEVANQLAETLVLSADKGIPAMEKVLRARGLKEAEIEQMQPYLKEFQAAAREGGMGIETSIQGQTQANSDRGKRKKK